MTPPVERALLFTDLVDSTRWAERLGDERARALWTAHDRAARDLLALHGGREIDRSDGFFLLFDDAAGAAGFAEGYHGALAALGLQARAGLHVGAVTLRANDAADVARGARPLEVDGLAKPFAARLMALAPPGRTLASAAAQAALAGEGESRGHYRLKGLEQPVEVFELGGPRAAAPPPDSDKAYRVVRDGDLWRPLREVRHNLPISRRGSPPASGW
jgi:class 3 adenylate cyclase